MAKSSHAGDNGPQSGDEDVIREAEAALSEGETDHANYLPKITIATVGGNPGAAKAQQKRVAVVRIGGIASALKWVDNAMDPETPWCALQGQFFATNEQTGAVYRSGVCYLPGGFHESIVEAIDKEVKRRELPDDDPMHRSKFEPVQVEFDLLIDAQPSANPSGYSYVAKSLRPVSKADPLAAMIEHGRETMKQLAAPEAR